MKHGIASERHAKKKYLSISKRKHNKLQLKDPGMTIMESYPYISASPDLEIKCECHGEGVVEIKCPTSIPRGESPSEENYKHLEKHNGIVTLKHSSEYYFQIQGQMAVTEREYGDFFVFTFNGGYYLERIVFNKNFWFEMLHELSLFWKSFILPELLLEKVPRKKRDELTMENTDVTLVSNILSAETIRISFDIEN